METARLEPQLRLELRGGAGALGALGQEDDLPAPLAGQPPQAFDDSGLAFAKRLPEVLDRLDVLPQPSLLTLR